MVPITREGRAEIEGGAFIRNGSPAMNGCQTCSPNRHAAPQRDLMVVARVLVRRFDY
jgi:hypothetical protein